MKGKLRRLRATKPKPGKLLTMLGTRCNCGWAMVRISVADFDEFDAAAEARDELGDCGASGRYIKGRRRAERGLFARNTRWGCGSARVRLGHEVEDGSDRRAPLGSDAEARARPVIRSGEGEARAALAALPGPRGGPRWRWAGAKK